MSVDLSLNVIFFDVIADFSVCCKCVFYFQFEILKITSNITYHFKKVKILFPFFRTEFVLEICLLNKTTIYKKKLLRQILWAFQIYYLKPNNNVYCKPDAQSGMRFLGQSSSSVSSPELMSSML